MSDSQQTKKYFKSIQVLRGLAVIPVYAFHQTIAGERCYSWGVWGVTVFFVLSGFLSALNTGSDEYYGLRRSIEYGIDKIRRIFPFHVIMLMIAFVMWIVSSLPELKADPGHLVPSNMIKFVLNLFLISDWIPHFPALLQINGEYNIVIWFLSASLLFYILTPVMRRGMHRLYDNRDNRRPYFGMACIVAYSVAWYLIFRRIPTYAYSYWYIYECPLARIADYLLGMHLGYIFAHASERRKENQLWVEAAASVVLSAVLVLCATFVLGGKYNLIVSAGFYYMIPVGMLVYSLVSLERIRKQTSGISEMIAKPFAWIGGISAYIYLCQVPVINGVHSVYKRLFGTEIPMWIWAAISIMATVVVSFIGSRLMDRRSGK